ncbi:MAG: uroporphyrinogen decarboxylase [Ignavibacteriae bacterium]|nr:MAG: uroporphyrinogen decarboxylase [Ignavibacteriota bacterium]
MTRIKNDIFLRACKQQKVKRTPIWIMRQAGRYLPEYRAVRAKADFLTMCKTPELAAEVTLQPIDLIGVDAAIIFSDILVIPEAMGMHLEMRKGEGPVFTEPIRSETDLSKVKKIDVASDLKYVLDAVTLTKKELNNRVPLIGFSGSPWTLLCYMIEGRGSKNFAAAKELIFNNHKLAHKILDVLADSISEYLSAKIEAGANAVQIFDTWAGILSQHDYLEFSLQYIEKIISGIKRVNEPVIYFPKGVHHNLNKVANCGTDVLGLDWTMNLADVRKIVGDKVALQGNLDPTVLFGSKKVIEKKALETMKSYGNGNGHIFNLGHGILPNAKPENVKTLVDFVKNNSSQFHK